MKLKELRKSKNMTAVELAKELGVRTRSILRWDKEGLGNASFKHVVKMSELFNVGLENFVKTDTVINFE